MRSRVTTALAELLAARIREHGPITFAEYMEACLYHPQYGYYSKAEQKLRRDYITSVDVSPIFGRLLLRQFHQMWDLLERPSEFSLVEAGSGMGMLAESILDAAADSFPEFYAALVYGAMERSQARRSGHQDLLRAHAEHGRFKSSAELPEQIPCGCVFSNELIDAFPVHRIVKERGELFEIMVGYDEVRGLHEEYGSSPIRTRRIREYLAEQNVTLLENQQVEVNLDAGDWTESVAAKLNRGFVLTIDYGHRASELCDEHHMRGTLLAYERHRATEDYFRAPGEQDLTAHVNFTALELAGLRSGLLPAGFTSQTNFLLSLARYSNFADIELPGADDSQRTRARLLFKTLIHPEGMGETFRVLAQRKGIESPQLAGFSQL